MSLLPLLLGLLAGWTNKNVGILRRAVPDDAAPKNVFPGKRKVTLPDFRRGLRIGESDKPVANFDTLPSHLDMMRRAHAALVSRVIH